jgi:hypothetical protein
MLSQLALRYRHSPAVEEGTPAPHCGPKAGDRLPDARIARDGQSIWLQEALATPTYHLLLCGSPVDWDRNQVAALQDPYSGLVAIHRLARDAAPAVLHDVDGHAFARLGVERAAHLLVRPDGYIGYRSDSRDLQRPRALSRPVAPRRPNPVDGRKQRRFARARVTRQEYGGREPRSPG